MLEGGAGSGGGGGDGGGGEDEAVLAFAAAARPMVGRADVSAGWRQDVARRGEQTTQIQRRDKRLVRRRGGRK